jgi:hypothetical protein
MNEMHHFPELLPFHRLFEISLREGKLDNAFECLKKGSEGIISILLCSEANSLIELYYRIDDLKR